MWIVDIDVGGTLTDGIFTSGEQVFSAKVDTTPHDLTVCLFDCLAQGAAKLRLCRYARLPRTHRSDSLVHHDHIQRPRRTSRPENRPPRLKEPRKRSLRRRLTQLHPESPPRRQGRHRPQRRIRWRSSHERGPRSPRRWRPPNLRQPERQPSKSSRRTPSKIRDRSAIPRSFSRLGSSSWPAAISRKAPTTARAPIAP